MTPPSKTWNLPLSAAQRAELECLREFVRESQWASSCHDEPTCIGCPAWKVWREGAWWIPGKGYSDDREGTKLIPRELQNGPQPHATDCRWVQAMATLDAMLEAPF